MITRLRIDNFKSLKGLDVTLGSMNFIVGPNASGKSNFAEALDFLAHAITEDLTYAVAEKGGFYNICYRKQRRARGAIAFTVDGTIKRARDTYEFTFDFQFRTRSEEIRADFYVASEELTIKLIANETRLLAPLTLRILRDGDKYVVAFPDNRDHGISLTKTEDTFARRVKSLQEIFADADEASSQHLLFFGYLGEYFPISIVARELQGLRVFQFNPRLARQPAAPSVHGELGRRGENLAAAIDRMRLEDQGRFRKLGSWLRDVVPTIGGLFANYTETRQFGLFFEEEGFAARWFAEDVSDGTIMSVALFLALLDKRHRIIVVEEPETSLHPWILRKFLDRCREQSSKSQILITTHSPLAVAQSNPGELFLMERREGITTMRRALEVEAALPQIVRKDLIDLGEYWLSGGLGAIPSLPEERSVDLFGESDQEQTS